MLIDDDSRIIIQYSSFVMQLWALVHLKLVCDCKAMADSSSSGHGNGVLQAALELPQFEGFLWFVKLEEEHGGWSAYNGKWQLLFNSALSHNRTQVCIRHEYRSGRKTLSTLYVINLTEKWQLNTDNGNKRKLACSGPHTLNASSGMLGQDDWSEDEFRCLQQRLVHGKDLPSAHAFVGRLPVLQGDEPGPWDDDLARLAEYRAEYRASLQENSLELQANVCWTPNEMDARALPFNAELCRSSRHVVWSCAIRHTRTTTTTNAAADATQTGSHDGQGWQGRQRRNSWVDDNSGDNSGDNGWKDTGWGGNGWGGNTSWNPCGNSWRDRRW